MEASFRRATGASGIVFSLLVLLSFVVGPGDPPGFNDSARMVAAYVGENRGEIQAALALTIAAAPFLLVFIAGVVRTLRQHEVRGPAMLAAVAFAGGLLVVAFSVLGAGLQWASAYHPGDLAPGVVRGLWDAGLVGFMAAVGIGFTALVGASSVIALAHGALPRLLGLGGAALAAFAFLVGIIAMFAETGAFAPTNGALPAIAFLAFLLWVLLVSAHMLTGKSAGSGAAS